jgi:hypothetical protein
MGSGLSNGLKLSREAPFINALDQTTQDQAKPGSFRRPCQDNASGASSDPTLSWAASLIARTSRSLQRLIAGISATHHRVIGSANSGSRWLIEIARGSLECNLNR